MEPSFARAAALGVMARLGLVKLDPAFPFKDAEELRALHRQSIHDQLEAFQAHGAKWYRISSAGGCVEGCSHRGEEYRVDEAVPGVTLPPFCDGCRCTIVPADDE